MDKQPVFTFHVLSLGKATQQLGESTQYINRPFLQLDGLRKKWGDEYVVINSPLGEVDDKPRTYLGCVDLDKKYRKYLKLFKEVDFPIENPDYYVVNVRFSGSRIEKVQDFFKQDPDSLSCILSSAYNKDDQDVYTTDMIIICRHGDGVFVNEVMHIFNKFTGKFNVED